jgi:hypothetical protein
MSSYTPRLGWCFYHTAILCLTQFGWVTYILVMGKNVRRGTTGLDRRLKYKIAMYRRGRCVNCGKKRGDSLFKRLCTECGGNARLARRKRLGLKPWKPGSPGRTPLRVLARKLQEESK